MRFEGRLVQVLSDHWEFLISTVLVKCRKEFFMSHTIDEVVHLVQWIRIRDSYVI